MKDKTVRNKKIAFISIVIIVHAVLWIFLEYTVRNNWDYKNAEEIQGFISFLGIFSSLSLWIAEYKQVLLLLDENDTYKPKWVRFPVDGLWITVLALYGCIIISYCVLSIDFYLVASIICFLDSVLCRLALKYRFDIDSAKYSVNSK